MYKSVVFAFIIIFSRTTIIAQIVPIDIKEELNIYEKIYDAPLNVLGDRKVSLHELYSTKPLLLALIFTRCSGICNPFLLQLKDKIRSNAQNKSFNVLVLSFDPADSLNDISMLAKRFDLEQNEQWIFGVTDSITKLNESISFYPLWDSTINQYNHDALLVGINSDGFITKKLIGLRQGHDFDLLISSINNIFSPTYRLPSKNLLFSCFNYNPKTGKNTPGLGLLFILLPAVLTLLLLISIRYFVKRKTAD